MLVDDIDSCPRTLPSTLYLRTRVSGLFTTARLTLNTVSPPHNFLCLLNPASNWPNVSGLNLKAASIDRISCCTTAKSGPNSTCLAVLLFLAYPHTTNPHTNKAPWLTLAILASLATSTNKPSKAIPVPRLLSARANTPLPIFLPQLLL